MSFHDDRLRANRIATNTLQRASGWVRVLLNWINTMESGKLRCGKRNLAARGFSTHCSNPSFNKFLESQKTGKVPWAIPTCLRTALIKHYSTLLRFAREDVRFRQG